MSTVVCWVLVAVLLVGLGLVVRYWVATISFPFPVDYGEGPLLDRAVRVSQGLPVYPRIGVEPPWTVSNYPPVYPWLDSIGVRVAGPGYWYGRLLSALSAMGSAAFAAGIVWTVARDRSAVLITGLLVPVIPYVGYWAGLARVDTVALLLSLAGLWCVVRWPSRTVALLAAVILLATAAFARQTYLLAAPAAAVVWLWPTGRRRTVLFAGALVGVVLSTGLLLNLITAGGFWFNVVAANVNEIQWDNLTWYVIDLGKRVPVLIMVLVAYGIIAVRHRPSSARLMVPYGSAAVLVAATAAKSGSSLNYLFELSTAMALAAGFLLAALRARVRLHLAALIAILVQALVLVAVPHPYYAITIGATRDLQAEKELARTVAEAGGPVLADEDAGLLPLVGQPIQFQPFELSQLSYAGRWDQTVVLTAIAEHRYAVILVYTRADSPVEQYRWTPEMLSAIQGSYRLQQRIARATGATLVYRPAT